MTRQKNTSSSSSSSGQEPVPKSTTGLLYFLWFWSSSVAVIAHGIWKLGQSERHRSQILRHLQLLLFRQRLHCWVLLLHPTSLFNCAFCWSIFCNSGFCPDAWPILDALIVWKIAPSPLSIVGVWKSLEAISFIWWRVSSVSPQFLWNAPEIKICCLLISCVLIKNHIQLMYLQPSSQGVTWDHKTSVLYGF